MTRRHPHDPYSTDEGELDARPSAPPTPSSDPPVARKGARVVCVASGKGGTGKSTLAANLAVVFAERFDRVTLVDADLGLANAHLLLGAAPQRTLLHVLRSGLSVEEVACPTRFGPRLISGGSGLAEIATLASSELFRLVRSLEPLRSSERVVVLDTSGGIGRQSLMFLWAARQIVLVTTPDLGALTDAYAVVKLLRSRSADHRIGIVVNRAHDAAEADRALAKLRRVSERFLEGDLESLGFVPEDPAAATAAMRGVPLVATRQHGAAAAAIRALADRILEIPSDSIELTAAIRAVAPAADFDREAFSRGAPRRHERRGRASFRSSRRKETR